MGQFVGGTGVTGVVEVPGGVKKKKSLQILDLQRVTSLYTDKAENKNKLKYNIT